MISIKWISLPLLFLHTHTYRLVLQDGYELISEALNLLINVYGAMHPEIAQVEFLVLLESDFVSWCLNRDFAVPAHARSAQLHHGRPCGGHELPAEGGPDVREGER